MLAQWELDDHLDACDDDHYDHDARAAWSITCNLIMIHSVNHRPGRAQQEFLWVYRGGGRVKTIETCQGGHRRTISRMGDHHGSLHGAANIRKQTA